ncbi:MAG: ABC transporter permease [Phycisphaerales bacterium]|nr:ABC transporter permease [Phycisphaerales bacterium]
MIPAASAIAVREYRSLFRVPVGWIVIALYLFLTGVVFVSSALIPGEPASLRYVFGISGWLLLPVMPAVSMRLFAEEFRSGTAEPLMTSPVSDASIVAGKYLGACLFLLTMLAPTLIYAVILAAVSDPAPDPGPILAGYLSLVLLGMLYLAVGTLVSSLTANQTLAFLGTFLFLLIALLLTGDMAARLPGNIGAILIRLGLSTRMEDFARGVIDTAHVVFFLSVSAWFLLLAFVAVESRRWR